jgi:hypothetical protein
MARFPRTVLAAFAAVLILVSIPAWPHDDGTEEFPCLDGPFGVPGLNDPPSQIGQWSAVTAWPEQATHAALLRTGKVLWWRGASDNNTSATTYVWDPDTDQLSSQLTPEDNIFCAGLTSLADGRVLALGGTVGPQNAAGLPDTNLFDPLSETWTLGNQSTYGRWYPTLTVLTDGRVLATSGRIQKDPPIIATIPEVWDPASGFWSELTGANLSLELYPQMFLLPDGRVLSTSTSGTTRALTVATESWVTINTSNYSLSQGSAAAYEPGRIMRIGGGSIGTADVETLDMTLPDPQWQVASQLSFPRRRPDLVTLPDGRLLAIGGSVEGQNSPECAMHAAEVWDPAGGQWTTWASMARPRIYHSTAMLLPDGRVLVAGGENTHVGGGEKNYEVFSPPYLFQGPRPQITSAPAAVGYGTEFKVFTPDAASISKVVLMRLSSVTHNFDMNQRYVPLSFAQSTGALDVVAPADGNLAPPGYYMLFLVDSGGVPSVASFVRLSTGVSLAGAVPDGSAVPGAQLTMTRSATPGDLDLSWAASCAVTDVDYVVYEGTLGEFTSHLPVAVPNCTTGGTTSATITPGSSDRYYLIVPLSDTGFEGAYGSRSDGTPRLPGLSSCEAQAVGVCP